MRLNHAPRTIKIMEVDRLKAFSDNIFGFSMTLLGTRITLPDVPLEHALQLLPTILAHEWRHFAMYAISFLSIGGYWVLHHLVFDYVRYSDRGMIWLNMVFLLTVTFLPFPTRLMAKYGRDGFTALIYGVTISVNYLMLYLLCRYACSDERYLKPDVDIYTRRLLQIRIFAPLVVAIIGTVLSFVHVRLSFWTYFLVVVVNSLPLTRLAKLLHIRENESMIPS